MAIFNSYVSLPEGIGTNIHWDHLTVGTTNIAGGLLAPRPGCRSWTQSVPSLAFHGGETSTNQRISVILGPDIYDVISTPRT